MNDTVRVNRVWSKKYDLKYNFVRTVEKNYVQVKVQVKDHHLCGMVDCLLNLDQ